MGQRNQSTIYPVGKVCYGLMEGHESMQVTQTVLRRRCLRKVGLRGIKGFESLRRTAHSCFLLLEKCREIIESSRASMCVVQSNARLFAA